MRILLAAACIAFLPACQPSNSAPANSEVRPFVIDRPLEQLTVMLQNGEVYRMSVFSDPRPLPHTDALNVFVVPPAGRYRFNQETKTFSHRDYYDSLTSSSSIYGWASHFRSQAGGDSLVMIALPGSYGSPGPVELHHSEKAIDILSLALDQLKAQTGAREINIVGYSATAPTVAGLMTRRHDLRCIALAAGVYDWPDFIEVRGWPTTYAGTRNPLSAVALLRDLPPDPQRSILIVTDRKDARSDTRYSEELFSVLQAGGHRATIAHVNATDPDHHFSQLHAIPRMLKCAGGSDF